MATTEKKPSQIPMGYPPVLLYDDRIVRPPEQEARRDDKSYVLKFDKMLVRAPVYDSSQGGDTAFLPKEMIESGTRCVPIRLRAPFVHATPDAVRAGQHKVFKLDTLQCPSLGARLFESTLAWIKRKADHAQQAREEEHR